MCYFSDALQYPTTTMAAICHALNDPKFDNVDFIVGTGISGTILLMPVSLKSDIPCGIVRKSVDIDTGCRKGGTHSSSIVEFCHEVSSVNRYVIIDDFVASGNTIKQIIETMMITYPFKNSQCTGIILYQGENSELESCMESIVEVLPTMDRLPVTYLHNDIKELSKIKQEMG